MARHVPSPRRSMRTVDSAPLPPRRVPYPPRGHQWHRESVAAWKAVMSSVVVGALIEADNAALLRWFRMVDRLNWAFDNPNSTPAAIKAISAEVRLLEQSLGLSPLARVQMRIAPEEPRRARAGTVGIPLGEAS